MPPMEPEPAGEYEWEESFEGTAYSIKIQVLRSGGKYDASAEIGIRSTSGTGKPLRMS